MKWKRIESDGTGELRRQAEARNDWEPSNIHAMSRDEVRNLVFELRTYQIELEIQNESLRRAQEELTESRDRYSDLYDFAPVGYVTTSHKGTILEANMRLVGMLDISRSDLIDNTLSSLVYPDDQDTYYIHRKAVLDSTRNCTCRIRLLKRNADPLWVELDSIPVEANDETDLRFRTIITDITDRRRAEAEILSLERQAQHDQKLESLGVLAGGIAHDFNNILHGILGNLELALDGLSKETPALPFLRNVQSGAELAADLAGQMLAYSGKGHFVVAPLNMSESVCDTARLAASFISKKIRMNTRLAPDLPAINADAIQMQQVTMNLIINAAEAVGEGKSGIITVSTGVREFNSEYLARSSLNEKHAPGKYVFLEVTDTGCGMDEDTRAKLFEPFFTTKFTGRGLGLSAILGIVRGHTGAIMIESEVGEGTTFRILFPALAEEAGKSRPTGDPARRSDWRGTGLVLVVDDEEYVRSLQVTMLERIGFETIQAVDGRDAIEVFEQNADGIAGVLLDFTMPRMDGGETFVELRKIRNDVPVILCSGYDEKLLAKRFVGYGLAGFIQKPFDSAKLRETFRRALEREMRADA